MHHGHTLTITLDDTTYETLTLFAAQVSLSIESVAAVILTADLVRCTEEEHGPELAGQIFTRGELIHRDLIVERNHVTKLQAQLEHTRKEIAHIAEALTMLVEE